MICKYFLPFYWLSFPCLYCSFCCANLLSLSRSHLFISVLISITITISIPLLFNLNFHKVGLLPRSTRADLVPASARVCLELGSIGAGLTFEFIMAILALRCPRMIWYRMEHEPESARGGGMLYWAWCPGMDLLWSLWGPAWCWGPLGWSGTCVSGSMPVLKLWYWFWSLGTWGWTFSLSLWGTFMENGNTRANLDLGPT